MKLVVLIGLLFYGIAAQAQIEHNFRMDPQATDCHLIPNTFSSIEAAYSKLEASTFRLVEEMNISRYNNPASAVFLSCDGSSGYLIVHLQDETFEIYEQVAKSEWDTFSQTRDPVYDYDELRKKLKPVTIE